MSAMDVVNADIWVLTETWTDFAPASGYKRVAYTKQAADLDAKSKRCWVAIWSKPNLNVLQLGDHGSTDRMLVYTSMARHKVR